MLTIADVTDKKFSTTRMREGYEVAEVDVFVAEVQETLDERDREIAELREQLAAAKERLGNGRANQVAAFAAATGDSGRTADQERDPVRQSSISAVRLLEIATANAEQLVMEAKADATSLIATARAAADQLAASSRDEAKRVSAELVDQRQKQEEQLREHRTAVLTEVADRKSALEAQVETLARMERENRERLVGYFAEQLARLEDSAAPDAPSPDDA